LHSKNPQSYLRDIREIDQKLTSELDDRFDKWTWLVVAAMVVIGILFAWSTHSLLVWLNWRLALADRQVDFILLPQKTLWWFFPGFGALALSYEITLQLWSLFGNREIVNLYSQWSNQKSASRGGRYAGMDSRKMLRWLSLLIALPIGILTVLALPMHASLRQNDIRDCGYAFKPCQVYSYTSAVRMTIIEGFRNRDGKLTRRAGVVLDFQDGRRWSSGDIGDFQKSVDPAIVDFLQRKTQLPINDSETEDDISK
jgi:hypothetical protein